MLDLNTSRSMRLPTFTDLYYTTSETHTADPNLKPEHAYNYQLGASYAPDRFMVKAIGYYRQGRQVIDWIKESNVTGAKWESHPIERLNTYGAELYLTYSGRKLIRQVSVSYGYVNSHNPDMPEGYTSRYAMDYMRNKIVISGSFRFFKTIFLDINGAWYDRNNDSSLSEAQDSPYWVLDARLSWRKGVMTLYLDATNLLDQRYHDFVGLPQPPRWFIGGIAITL